LNFEVKNIIKKLEKEFNELFKKSLRKYCIVIEHIG
jgi:hypothetical protein